MIKKLSTQVFALCLTLMTLTGCAAKMPTTTGKNADPAAQFLANLFGNTPSHIFDTTTGGLHHIFSTVFQSFNAAVLSGGMLIFAYTLIMGTIYTAQDGIFLGKKWGKTLVPLRAIIGVISVVPMGSYGFCLAQWVIYTMAFTAIWIANQVWTPISQDIKPANNSQTNVPVVPMNIRNQIKNDAAQLYFNGYVQGLLPSVKCDPSKSGCNLPSKNIQSNPISRNVVQTIMTNSSSENNLANYVKSIDGKPNQNPATQPSIYVADQFNKNLKNSQSLYPGSFSNVKCNTLSSGNSTYYQCFYYQGRLQASAITSQVNISRPTNTSTAPYVMNAEKTLNAIATNVAKDSDATAAISNKDNKEAYANEITNIIQNLPNDEAQSTEGKYHLVTGNAPTNNQLDKYPHSWWTAGDHYLDLDATFAKNIAKVMRAANAFNTNTQDFNFNAAYTVKGLQFVWTAQELGRQKIGVLNTWPAKQMTPLPTFTVYSKQLTPGESFNLSTVAQNLYQAAASGQMGDNTNSAYHLACAMGNQSACSKMPDIFAPNGVPYWAPASLSSSPLFKTDFSQQLSAYFATRQYLHDNGLPCDGKDVCPVFNSDQIRGIDNNLAFAIYMDDLPTPVLPNSGGKGLSTQNDFVLAGSSAPNQTIDGQNSGMRDTLGFLFQGLLGYQVGNQYYGGLMNEVWCIGMPSGYTQNGKQVCPNNLPNDSDPSLVAEHFSMIRSAQIVGVNLISGVVDGLMTTFSNYKKLVEDVLNQSGSGVKNSDIVAAAALGPMGGGAWSGINNAKIQKSELAVFVALANLSMTLMWLPLMIFVFTIMFTTGIMFAIIIPLLPYILYWAGKVAWILVILEGLFAAPLVGLAIAYPDGHDVWGMAENGFKMSFNILLMPVLIVGGLISAIALTYCVITMSAEGFHLIVYSILNLVGAAGNQMPASGVDPVRANTIIEGTMGIFLVFMYAYFLQMAFEKCFSAIYVIPERVMQWIGGQGVKFGEQEMGKMTQKAEQTASQGMQAAGQTTSQGTQAEGQVGQAEAKEKFGDQRADSDAATAIGRNTTEFLQTTLNVASGGQ